MQLVCALFALLAVPFWETKAPTEWSEAQIALLMHDSPWAQMADPAPTVQVYLASAHPLREAEAELARRRAKPLNDEYLDFLEREGGHNLVLAIAYKNAAALSDSEEARHMEEESVMKVGHRKYKMEGHFPPVPSDPFLRLVFPRVVTERDKTIAFELYLPGYGPYHQAEFRVKDLLYKGKLEM
ncbi:MAG TPA: hypothetical protein VKR61_02480 [Bryobacteraceae bacterium]|nr:hypothetical protein [Bryobacteraceae bacterium]